jgi:hypothetical protein
MRRHQSKSYFIGREEWIERLNREIFQVPASEAVPGVCRSIIGPNGIGKTTLVRELAKQLEASSLPNVYYFAVSIEDTSGYWIFWTLLIQQFAEKIKTETIPAEDDIDRENLEALQKIYDFFCRDDNINNMDKPATQVRAIGFLNHLFELYTDLGIRIILSIDEFDRAHDAFSDGGFFQRLFDLTPKGQKEYSLSIITISRRSVGTIAHDMKKGSNFEDAFPSLTLRGFTNDEIGQYFETYRDFLPNGLSEDDQKKILFLCGRSPYLLMGFRREIMLLGTRKFDVAELYSDHCKFISVAYDHMCKLMQSEYVDTARTVNCLGKFIQAFIGPAYDENLPLYMEKLNSFGFISKLKKDEIKNSIFNLTGENWDFEYEPISPYFIEYVKSLMIPDEQDGLARTLEHTERQIRKIILFVLKKHYPNNWEEIIQQGTPQMKDAYLQDLAQTVLKTDALSRGFQYTKLNVLSYLDYGRLIQKHWPLMEMFFRSYSFPDVLQKDMELLNTARKSYAHINREVLDRKTMEDVLKVCRVLENDFTTGFGISTTRTASETAGMDNEAVPPADAPVRTPRDPDEVTEGDVAIFTASYIRYNQNDQTPWFLIGHVGSINAGIHHMDFGKFDYSYYPGCNDRFQLMEDLCLKKSSFRVVVTKINEKGITASVYDTGLSLNELFDGRL